MWAMHAHGWRVVVTTNIGWCPVTGRNNMGAGMALQAAQRWPELPAWLGGLYKRRVQDGAERLLAERPDLGLVFLPVKPLLDAATPERSWDQCADLGLIEQGCEELSFALERHSERPVAMAYPGCGNGGLMISDVHRVLERTLWRAVAEKRLQLVDLAGYAPLQAPKPSPPRAGSV